MDEPLPSACLENDLLRVEYLTGVGPRLIGLYRKGVPGSLLALTPGLHWPTPHGEYHLHGGHRLWTAPEDPFYTPPDGPVTVSSRAEAVSLRGRVEPSGMEKEISFRLDGPRVDVQHRITWHGDRPIEVAPWAITQLRLGGLAVLPQSTLDTGLKPNRSLVLWPYSRLADERLTLRDDFLLVHGRPAQEAFKIGQFNPAGWAAYALGEVLFTKHFPVHPAGRYPDLGCNVEVYVKDACLELETLGPLVRLGPGDTVRYGEVWEVTAGDFPPAVETADTIKALHH